MKNILLITIALFSLSVNAEQTKNNQFTSDFEYDITKDPYYHNDGVEITDEILENNGMETQPSSEGYSFQDTTEIEAQILTEANEEEELEIDYEPLNF